MKFLVVLVLVALIYIFAEKILAFVILIFTLFSVSLALAVSAFLILLTIIGLYYLLKFLFSKNNGNDNKNKSLHDDLHQQINSLKQQLDNERKKAKELEKMNILYRTRLKKLSKT